MKKQSALFITWALVSFVLNTSSAQVRFGIKAGLNLASISYSDDYIEYNEVTIGGDISTGMIPAYHLGGLVEFDFGSNIGLSTGLELNVKGGSLDLEGVFLGQPYTAESEVRPMYLQVPAVLTYRKNGFYAGVGPYIGFGIGGKIKTEVDAGGQSEEDSDTIEFGSDSGDSFASLDYGARLELGYEFNNIRVSASYNFGLANAVPKDAVDEGEDIDLDFKYRHNVIGISVAYLFKGKADNVQ